MTGEKMKFLKVKRCVVGGMLLVVAFLGQGPLAFASEDQQLLAKALSHYTMGLVYDFLGLTQEAVLEYEQAALWDQENHAIHLRLGIDYARLGHLSQAIEELKLAVQIQPEDLQPHYILALVYSTQKDFDKAASEYELILQHFSKAEPENIEVFGYLGQLYYSQGRFDKAIEQFKRILSLEPDNAEVMYLLGSLYLELEDRPQAIEFFKRSIMADPEHEGSLNSLGYVYAEDGINLDEAVGLLERALKISPNNGAYLDSLGWIYYKKEMYAQALELLKQTIGLIEDPVIYDHLGDVYWKMNEDEQARKYWELSLELSPNQKHITAKLDNLKNRKEKEQGEQVVSHQEMSP